MPEETKTQKLDLTEVMLTMDVVDTLRHQRSLVERELRSDEYDQELVEKVRKIYADQGLEVSEDIVTQGVAALREDRFTYRPPKGGFQTRLARVYVNRGRWAKRFGLLILGLLGVYLVYQLAYVVPSDRSRAKAVKELSAQVAGQLDSLKLLAGQLDTLQKGLREELKAVSTLVSAPIQRLASQARQSLALAARHLEAVNSLNLSPELDRSVFEAQADSVRSRLGKATEFTRLIETDLKAAAEDLTSIQALKAEGRELEATWSRFEQEVSSDAARKAGGQIYAQARQSLQAGRTGTVSAAVAALQSLHAMPENLSSLRARTLDEALEDGVADRIETLYRDGMDALGAGDAQGAQKAYEALQQLYDQLRQEYVLQIVSRPGVPSGVWRYPVNNPSGRNYYLIVEAVTADGRRLALPVTSEEDGQTRVVSLWGLRVDGRIYDAVAQDKQDDGIVNRNRFGVKKRGYLAPEYMVPTTGGAITEW